LESFGDVDLTEDFTGYGEVVEEGLAVGCCFHGLVSMLVATVVDDFKTHSQACSRLSHQRGPSIFLCTSIVSLSFSGGLRERLALFWGQKNLVVRRWKTRNGLAPMKVDANGEGEGGWVVNGRLRVGGRRQRV
jgi:hypothetical protein